MLIDQLYVRESSMAITDWPEDERPRERLLAQDDLVSQLLGFVAKKR